MGLAEKINSLIRLSASPNENEARNAAFEACRYLRENNIYLKPSIRIKQVEDTPMPKMNFDIMREVFSNDQAHAVMTDLENAGFKANQELSMKEMDITKTQCLVLNRTNKGKTQYAKIQMIDHHAPPRARPTQPSQSQQSHESHDDPFGAHR